MSTPAPSSRPGAAPASPFRVGAVLLAAGASSRMGEPKQLMLIDGSPMIVRATKCLLESEVWPVVVVLGANAAAIRPTLARLPVLVAENPAWAEGMASSLRAGINTLLQFSRTLDAVVIALCDQPALSPGIVRQLIATAIATGRSRVAARYADRNGAPALFGCEHFGALASLTGEEGARTLLNREPDAVAAVDLPALAVDLDTPEDFAGFRGAKA